MTSPSEEALVGPIVDTVTALLEAVLKDDAATVATSLSTSSLKRVGLSLFGLDALAIPMGLAAKPHQLGLTSAEVGDDMAIAELRGRAENGDEVCVSTVILVNHEDGWKVEDIWPVPADCDFSIDAVLEPTVMFYNGQLQLKLADTAVLDSVEQVLLRGLQADGLGLHLIEQGVRIWRSFNMGAPAREDAAGWAAGVHLAVLALDDADPDPGVLASSYGVPDERVAECFMQIAGRLGGEPQAEQPPPVERPSGLVDSFGRPLPPSGRTTPGAPGGIILPRG